MSKRLLGELELNRIYQRECIDGMRMIPDKSIDMILCDLPYGTTACKWDTIIPFEALWAQYERIIKDNGAIVLTSSQPFTSSLIMSNLKLFRYVWVWDKKTATGGQNASFMPMRAHEDICVFSIKKCNYNPQMEEFSTEEIKRQRKKDAIIGTSAFIDGTPGKRTNVSKGWFEGKKKYPRSVVRINGLAPMSSEKKIGKHPTQKPVSLFEYLIRTYTNEGEIVLDNCMGSGTTAIAALRTGRQFLGFETEREYVEIANKRIDNEPEAE